MLTLNGVSFEDRIGFTFQLREAMTMAGAWVIDSHQFSNTSVCMNFEISGAKLGALRHALEASGLQLSRTSLQQFEVESTENVEGTLQITFVHDQPDLRIPVPPIPG